MKVVCDEEDEDLIDVLRDEYLLQIAKFVQGISRMSNFRIKFYGFYLAGNKLCFEYRKRFL